MRLPALALLAALSLQAQVPRATEVQERRLANGIRVLLVERRGLAAFHGALVFRGGRAEEPHHLPAATDLLASALYGTTRSEDLEPGRGPALEALLRQEEGLLESLRLERARDRRLSPATSQTPALEASLAAVQAKLAEAATGPDIYEIRGGRLQATADADALTARMELPAEAFGLWCRTEAQRLQSLRLSRFSQARADLAARLRALGTEGTGVLLGAAFPGHPYGRDLAFHLSALEAIRASDLRAYARRALAPGRLLLVVVGPFTPDGILPELNRTLGALPAPPESEEGLLPEIPPDLGDRRVQAALGLQTRLLVGWRIPPRAHPEHLALRVLAQVLGGGASGRITHRLGEQKQLIRASSVRLDLPGGRFPGLLAADLQATEGHGLPELERALHSEVLRLQQEPIPAEEWQRALAQLEAEHLHRLDEPAALASALGRAWVETGDWRSAEQEAARLRSLGPEQVQGAARTWLNPAHRTSVWIEPGAAAAQDPQEQEMARVLGALAKVRMEDPAQQERLVAEGMKQLRMLGPEERARTLRLLAAQLPKEPR